MCSSNTHSGLENNINGGFCQMHCDVFGTRKEHRMGECSLQQGLWNEWRRRRGEKKTQPQDFFFFWEHHRDASKSLMRIW